MLKKLTEAQATNSYIENHEEAILQCLRECKRPLSNLEELPDPLEVFTGVAGISVIYLFSHQVDGLKKKYIAKIELETVNSNKGVSRHKDEVEAGSKVKFGSKTDRYVMLPFADKIVEVKGEKIPVIIYNAAHNDADTGIIEVLGNIWEQRLVKNPASCFMSVDHLHKALRKFQEPSLINPVEVSWSHTFSSSQTFLDRLKKAAQFTIDTPKWDFGDELSIPFTEERFPDPIEPYLSRVSKTSTTANRSRIHGDLNTSNAICLLTDHREVDEIRLIDFSHVKDDGFSAIDYARIEVDLWSGMFANISNPDTKLQTQIEIFNYLSGADCQLNKSYSETILNFVALIARWRSHAKTSLSQSSTYLYEDYYYCLYFGFLKKLSYGPEGPELAGYTESEKKSRLQTHLYGAAFSLNLIDMIEVGLYNTKRAYQVDTNLLALSADKTKTSIDGAQSSSLTARDNKRFETRISGFKLFYERLYKKQITRKTLAKLSGLSERRIATLETVKQHTTLGPECFKRCSRSEILALEEALGINSSLDYYVTKNYLANYQGFYQNNWKKRQKRGHSSGQSLFSKGKTRAVVFDFGGTLSISKHQETTWERMWTSVGYLAQYSGDLHRRFTDKLILHQEWCDITCEKLRARNFSEKHFKKIYADITAVPELHSTFAHLYENDIKIYITSGSLEQIISHTIGEAMEFVERVSCNKITFDEQGLIEKITGHDFDFEGKAKFIENVCAELNCSTMEVLFVGNSFNDEEAGISGARTLCVNPQFARYQDTNIWNNFIKEMKSLKEVLDYI